MPAMIRTPTGGLSAGLGTHLSGGRDASAQGSQPGVVLLVNADDVVLRRTEWNLARAGFSIAAVSSFEEARRLLAILEPDLLIADVRLGAFNGLHLAARSYLDRPDMPVFITYPQPDPIFERAAAKCRARFIVAPADNPDLVNEVQAALKAAIGAERVRLRRIRKPVAGAPPVDPQ
jgi:DNA-binding NtrC family response regulator